VSVTLSMNHFFGLSCSFPVKMPNMLQKTAQVAEADNTQTQRNFSLPVVIIEDDVTTLEILCAILRGNGMNPVPFSTGLEAINYIRLHPEIGALLIDLSLPDMDGIELLREARKVRNHVPGYILTARNDVESAVKAMKAGANDYFTKPFDPLNLVATLHAALSLRSPAEDIYAHTMAYHDRWESACMKSALADARRAALSTSPVVILGPSGVGKSPFARLIHDLSSPPRKAFRMVNLAELTEEQMEAKLFGNSHSAGGTAAVLERSGGDTIHLGNIHSLGLRAQASLLDWLERNPPTAAADSVTRLICSTSVDMERAMDSGAFRRDLWFLLAVHQVNVPSLRMRGADLTTICEDILTAICVKGKLRRPTITRMAMLAIQDYHWPHNIMELHNALEHAVASTQDGLISPADLPRYVFHGDQQPQPNADKMALGEAVSIEEVTKASLEAALKACDGNRRRVAQRLKVSLRTVYYMIKRYDLGGTGKRDKRTKKASGQDA